MRVLKMAKLLSLAIILVSEMCFSKGLRECLYDQFQCTDGQDCISIDLVCDSGYDCADRSDEEYCDRNYPSNERFLCNDWTRTIEPFQVCDGQHNCRDGSDEDDEQCKGNCRTKSCPPHSVCIPGRIEAACLCSPNYKYNSELNTCDDIDECKTFGKCSQGCSNTNGSHTCTCVDRYKLQSDNKSCRVSYGEPLLLYTTGKAVKGIYLKSRHAYTVADNQTTVIARASMDGAEPVALVKTDIHWPNGIALDIHNERLYWVDAKLMTIESSGIDGTARQTIQSDMLRHPYGIAVFEDNLYWSDWNTKSIRTCHKFTGNNQEVIAEGDRMYSLLVYHPADQPKGEHACKKRKCSHLCLLAANNSSTCACPDGMSLAIDRRRCVNTSKRQTLYLALRNNLFEMEHTTFGKHKVLQEHTLSMFIHQMAYNSVNRSILIADNVQKVIAEYNVARRELRDLIRGTVGNVTGMAFDPLGQNLYWTDSDRQVVEVYSLRMKQRAIVHFFTGMALPMGIGLLPEDGKMFIVLRLPNKVSVMEKTLSGHGDRAHVFENITGMGPIPVLADYDTRTLYWVDTDRGKVEFLEIDGGLASPTIVDWTLRVTQPASMVLIDNNVLWTTLNSTFLYWTQRSFSPSVKKIHLDTLTLKTVTRIQLLSSRPQAEHDHPCLHNNGRCSHICVALGKNAATCLCPSGLLFKDLSNQTCIEALDCEFRCKSGECLTKSRQCNGRKDCSDGSVEAFCDSKPKKTQVICAFDEFMCHDSTQCVLNELRCDKKKDCRDGSDEEHCETFDDSKKCHNHQHACDNGRCVDLSVMCDGFDDCGDKSDEANCDKKTEASKPKCGKDMFQCTSGTCIAKSWECDGSLDCSDGSDEHAKCALINCAQGMHKCNLGQCIDERLLCDGHNDCGDNSDELKCVDPRNKVVCGEEFDTFGNPKMFHCPSEPTVCLDWRAKCNGTAECPGGEDEIACHGCSVFEFRCKTTSDCISIDFHCDGESDCLDGSDELNCKASTNETSVRTCDRGMFDCKDGTCVNDSKTCDGVLDCANGQDEAEICTTACAKGNFCEQKCHPTLRGAKCGCFDGFELAADKKKCRDINECLQADNPCAQGCENFPGGYRCYCYSGFMMRPDKNSCKSLEGGHAVLFATHNQIRSLTESPRALQLLWSVNDTTIVAFDLDIARKKLYYVTREGDVLFEWNMGKGGLTRGLAVENASKLAVDWITGNVYVVSRVETYRLRVCDFEKQLCADVIKLLPMETMTAVAVDAINRKVFYTAVPDSAASTHICVAGLDGYRHRILVTTPAKVTALEADTYKQELYFVDARSHTLLSISYGIDGNRSVKTVIRNENAMSYPTAISIHENKAYIVNLGVGRVYFCRLYGDRACAALQWNVNATGIVVVNSPSRQKIAPNDCYHKKCSGLCVLGRKAYECICPDGTIHDEYSKCTTDTSTGLISANSNTDNAPASATAAVLWTLAVVLVIAGTLGYLYIRRTRNARGFESVSVQMK